ncbi:hypothetical protein CIHG_00343 [Coccidioides immitis H538.4]|uniref:Zn(2)-C6 fungal-type domain-containing protein n=3 Tax=Coccidioides immitis TaxID=5501 RepID=A0A0J8QLK0_COCIT|nr:hypothetical protein CIRG_07164 [Coccidioides immitis RMSCC 2394]KMU72068.1 hypothetical protein CISG_00377 [Coccidioides immitis RMSCC 3703]KMU82562.1 hypothetical protein CIHG_00343 [Coccidioides immitis H538.4]TPX19421.1 hypothetical protein DIZ76_017210 [Coccidioides immitis]
MPQPPTIFPKLHVSARPPEYMSASSTPVAFPKFGPSQHAADTHLHQQIFRTRRKHVLKACDRCRVKKTKCDGNQPCYRCASYNHPCLFRERKVTQTKTYSRGFVEMLESHHALVVKALQKLYTHCINNKCFPGEPIDVVDGYPLTHAILDRLGLIKEAEESTSHILDEDAIEASQYWRFDRRCAGSVDSEDTSSTQASPIERSPASESTSGSPPPKPNGINREQSFAGLQDVYTPYGPFPCTNDQVWPVATTSTPAQVVDFTITTTTSEFQAGARYLTTTPTNGVGQDTSAHDSTVKGPSTVPSGHSPQSMYHGPYTGLSNLSYQHSGDNLSSAEQYTWAPNPWNRIKDSQHLDLHCP